MSERSSAPRPGGRAADQRTATSRRDPATGRRDQDTLGGAARGARRYSEADDTRRSGMRQDTNVNDDAYVRRTAHPSDSVPPAARPTRAPLRDDPAPSRPARRDSEPRGTRRDSEPTFARTRDSESLPPRSPRRGSDTRTARRDDIRGVRRDSARRDDDIRGVRRDSASRGPLRDDDARGTRRDGEPAFARTRRDGEVRGVGRDSEPIPARRSRRDSEAVPARRLPEARTDRRSSDLTGRGEDLAARTGRGTEFARSRRGADLDGTRASGPSATDRTRRTAGPEGPRGLTDRTGGRPGRRPAGRDRAAEALSSLGVTAAAPSTLGGGRRPMFDAPVDGTAALQADAEPLRLDEEPLRVAGEPRSRAGDEPGVPRLRVAPPPPTGMPRAPFIAGVLTVVVAGVLGILLINTKTNENSFKISDLQQQNTNLTNQKQDLANKLTIASEPGSLEAAARRLGLVKADKPAMIRLPDGKIIGVLGPADGQPSVTSQDPLNSAAPSAGVSKAPATGTAQAGTTQTGTGTNPAGTAQTGTAGTLPNALTPTGLTNGLTPTGTTANGTAANGTAANGMAANGAGTNGTAQGTTGIAGNGQ